MISFKVFNCIMIGEVRVTAGTLGVYGVRVTSLRYPVNRKHQDSSCERDGERKGGRGGGGKKERERERGKEGVREGGRERGH